MRTNYTTNKRFLNDLYGSALRNISELDVLDAYSFTLEAAANDRCLPEIQERIRKMVADVTSRDQFAGKIIRHELERAAC
ncbi:MAG: hypothetical protein ACOY32_00580 [Thermodesulfobacteriota bacterium]